MKLGRNGDFAATSNATGAPVFKEAGKGTRGNVVALLGGLGNQLFQVAYGERLSAESGAPTAYDTCRHGPHPDLVALAPRLTFIDTCHRVPGFGPTGRLRHVGNGWRRLTLRLPVHTILEMAGPPTIAAPSPAYWCGYWQRPDHAEAVPSFVAAARHELRSHADWLQELRTRHPRLAVIAIHVRRGDYLLNTPTLIADYFNAAHSRLLAELRLSSSDVVAAITTNDADWVRRNLALPSRLVIAEGTSALSDLATLALADARVVSHSTFGWWAARLAPRSGADTTAAPVPWALSRRLDDVGAHLRLPKWHGVAAAYETAHPRQLP